MVSIWGLSVWVSLLQAPTVVQRPFPASKLRDTSITYIILHNDSSLSPATTFRWLRRKKASYHYYIDRAGTIHKLIDPRYVAGHAGLSYYDGHWQLNRISIGICLQNQLPQDYTAAQYTSLRWLVNAMHRRYPNSKHTPILGHDQVAWPRGRKYDPGEHFDWTKFQDQLRR
jgi:N-acetyl-anhydromuramyl-L-alanine amidase AmpD